MRGVRAIITFVVALTLALLPAGAARANHTQDTGLRCSDLASQSAAQAFHREHPYDAEGLDGPPGPNNDATGQRGVACEDLECPCDRDPVTYRPGNDAPTIPIPPTTPTSAPQPGSADSVGSSGTNVPSPTAPGATTGATITTGTDQVALPAPASERRDLRLTLVFTGVAAFIVAAYVWWLARDHRRRDFPTQDPRWPTEW